MATRSSKRLNPSDPDFHRADWPFYWIARVNTLYVQEMERALKAVDCDIPTYRVLAILQEQGVSSVSDIALHAVAKLSTITKIVYRMKAEDLVSTSTSETDGRVTLVSMTDAGRIAVGRIKDATHGLFERGLDGLTPAKLEKLNESLRVVFRNLNGGDHPILDAVESDD